MAQQGLFVYVIDEPTGKAQTHPVKIAHQNMQEAALASRGVKEGEQIITAGQCQLRPGHAGRHPDRAVAELTMSGGFSALFIRRPVATTLLMLALLLMGLVAYPLLPVAPLPQIDFPTISVSARFPAPRRRRWRPPSRSRWSGSSRRSPACRR